MGESGQPFLHEPRAAHPRGAAPSAKIESRQRADDDILHGQATPAQPGFIEQRTSGDQSGLTKSLALELGSEGIRFNSILPATIETDRIRDLASSAPKRRYND